ncbi:MAG: tetratricopeptide repeat protein [Saprospiraceae bacterium]
MLKFRSACLGYMIACLVLSFQQSSFSQQSAIQADPSKEIKRGLDLYSQGVYGPAREIFDHAIESSSTNKGSIPAMTLAQARLMKSLCSTKINRPDGQKDLLNFVKEQAPDPVANEAIIEIGDYFYQNKKYDEALTFYQMIDASDLPASQRADIKFKEGYSYFIKKKFYEAKNSLRSIMNLKTKYYYPANYYYAMSCYFTKDYPAAITGFKNLEDSKKYEKLVPFYIAQIYFVQGKYDEVIKYAEPLLDKGDTGKDAEINQLVGESYFEKTEYANALPYLEKASIGNSRMREDDYYQLGYAYYKAEDYGKAIEQFNQLGNSKSKIAQHGLYYLADCYLKKKDKNAARNAFQKVASLDFDKGLQEEAQFNYAKLSAELNYDTEAVKGLQKIPTTSRYFNESQQVMADVLVNTKDYDTAIRLLEGMKNQTPRIKETYQKVTYSKGVKLYNEGNYDEALQSFDKSLSEPTDEKIQALAYFWKGDISYREGNYDASIASYNKYFELSRGQKQMPDLASFPVGAYNQGYNYLKLKNYAEAGDLFNQSIDHLRANERKYKESQVTDDLYVDALMRAGDCAFKQNKYPVALSYYDEAIARKRNDFTYAVYQKAMIRGLQGDNTDKIKFLDKLIKDYPDSKYVDESLFAKGSTLLEMNKLNDAIDPFKQLTTYYKGKSPLINRSYIKLGLIHFNQNKYETALGYYKEVFKNNPNSAESNDAITAIKEIYVEKLRKPDEYFALIEKMPQFSNSSADKDETYFDVGNTPFENAEYDKAIAGFTEYLKKYPAGKYSIQTYYQRADSYAFLKKYKEAFADYEKVIQKGTSDYFVRALDKAALIAYNSESDFNKSYTYYNQLLEATDDPKLRFQAQLGALQSAYRIRKFDVIPKLTLSVVNNSLASNDQKASAYFYGAKTYIEQKQYDAAVEPLNQVIKLSDNQQSAESRYWMAYIYYAKKDYDTAGELAQLATQDNSAYPYWVAKSLLLMADILKEKRDYFNAQAALEALIENFSSDAELLKEAQTKLDLIKKLQDNEDAKPKNNDTEIEMDGN